MRVLLLFTLALAGCAAAEVAAPPAEIDSTQAAYHRCLQQKVINLDDPSSDAMTVARAVANACDDLAWVYLRARARGESPHWKNGFYGAARGGGNVDTALRYVLELRAARRGE